MKNIKEVEWNQRIDKAQFIFKREFMMMEHNYLCAVLMKRGYMLSPTQAMGRIQQLIQTVKVLLEANEESSNEFMGPAIVLKKSKEARDRAYEIMEVKE